MLTRVMGNALSATLVKLSGKTTLFSEVLSKASLPMLATPLPMLTLVRV